MYRKSLLSPRGFSLIDAMMAMVVMVLGLSALRNAFPTHLATERQASERVQATLLGKNYLEQLRLRGFAALAALPQTTTPEPFVDDQQQVVEERFRVQMTRALEAEDLVAVHVKVVWPWPASTHQVQLATYISRHDK